MTGAKSYHLEDQIGFVLRRVTQRHLALFATHIPEATTTQFFVRAPLSETGALSQNQLGRAAAMDAATIKGVVDRLARLGLVATAAGPGRPPSPDPDPDRNRGGTVCRKRRDSAGGIGCNHITAKRGRGPPDYGAVAASNLKAWRARKAATSAPVGACPEKVST